MYLYKITSVLLFLQLPLVNNYMDYEDLDDQKNEDSDYYVTYDDVVDVEEPMNTSRAIKNNNDTNNAYRIRRHQNQTNIKTLSPEDIREVRGALNQLLADKIENPFTPQTTPPFTDYRLSISDELNISTTTPIYTVLETSSVNPSEDASDTASTITSEENITLTTIFLRNSLENLQKNFKLVTEKISSPKFRSTKLMYEIENTIDRLNSISRSKESKRRNFVSLPKEKLKDNKEVTVIGRNQRYSLPTRSSKLIYNIRDNIDTLNSILYRNGVERRNFLRQSVEPLTTPINSTDATDNTTLIDDTTITTDYTTVTTTEEARSRELDIPRLLDIIADLASDFETNLTRKLNETLVQMSIPTCTTPTTTTEVPQTDAYDANYTGSVVAKCFVCGLDIPGIPQHAHCADAFAGDFLPLVPVDASAKGKISRFRKYCKYSNIRGYYYNETQPRAIFGRWTGGCAVRWIDLSGVYTQRTCRNRLQPTMGKHFASKRMAKLERSLWNVENGCIVSPVATLVPLSRGISLYARFHACVCAGNWCNRSNNNVPWTVINTIVSIIMFGIT